MPSIDSIETGADLPERKHRPDNVDLFLYNAVLWNAHRIHYDEPYATRVEGYPGLVVQGPLLGDWMSQAVTEWLGEDGVLVEFEYSNRQAAYLGETLRTGGQVTSVDLERGEATLELFVRNEAGDIVAPGTARVRFGGASS